MKVVKSTTIVPECVYLYQQVQTEEVCTETVPER